MTLVERKLSALLKAVLDECEHNASFRERLSAALESDDEFESRQPSRARPIERGRSSPGAKRLGRRPPGPIDPFAVYQTGEDRDPLRERRGELDGEAELRRRLGELDDEALKDIIAEHSMDPSRLAMKWKDPARLIDLIVKVVIQRRRKGEVFLTPEFRVKVSDTVYVSSWKAVIIGVEILNRGPADTITSIELRIGDQTYSNSMPDPSKVIPKLIGEAPKRIEQNDGVEGALYFGPSLQGGSAVPKAPGGELIIRRASGATQRSQVNIRGRDADGG